MAVAALSVPVAAAETVDEYIRAAPAEARPYLKKVRSAIIDAAPDAAESIGYGMPFYSYREERGIAARLCYFGLQKDGIGLFFRPRDLGDRSKELEKYMRTNSALRFSLEEPVPVSLIKSLVRDARRRHRALRAK